MYSGYCMAERDAGRETDREYYLGIAQRAYRIEDDDEMREAEQVAVKDGSERSYLDLLRGW